MKPEEAKKFSSALALLNAPDVRSHHDRAIEASVQRLLLDEPDGGSVDVFEVLAAAGYIWEAGVWCKV